jgi:PAS domain S-box-containing protein
MKFEGKAKCRDGTIRDMEVDAKVITYKGGRATLKVARDITDRRHQEEQLRKLFRAVEQSPSTVMITDTKGNIEYVNHKFTEVSGYTLQEALRMNAAELGEQEESAEEQMWNIINSGREWHGEFRNKKKNGELYWELASISPVRNQDGIITHFTKVAEDITGRKRMEEELQRAEAEKRLTKMKDQFIAAVTHELRTPLVSIKGYLDLVLKAEQMSGKVESDLRVVKRNTDRLLSLTNDLLDIQRMQAGRLQLDLHRLNIHEAMDHAVDEIKPLIDGKQHLDLEVPEEPSLFQDTVSRWRGI